MRYGPRVHVALIGLRCSGKTSVGRELAELLARPFVDLDEALAIAFEAERGPPRRSAGEILAREGEPVFRGLEERVLAETLASPQPLVIATGGGAIEREVNRARLACLSTCVWLRVETEELERRMRADRMLRPALSGADPVLEIESIARRRTPLYAATADVTVDGGARSAGELARAIRAELAVGGNGPEG